MALTRILISPLLLGFACLFSSLHTAGAEERPRQAGQLPQTLEGLGVSSKDPIQFEAEKLEVREKERVAVFSGNVIVRQNKTVLKAAYLTVTYADTQTSGAIQQVRRLEAEGDVLVTSGAQTASGSRAVFDTAQNTIILSGDVVLTQGKNIIRGTRLVIDIARGEARMEGGRVQMLIEPKTFNPPRTN